MATIKGGLALSDGVFGSVLFAMSAGVVLSLPISGWAIAKLGSRVVGVAAILINAMLLLLVPFAATVPQLAALLFSPGSLIARSMSRTICRPASPRRSAVKPGCPFFHGIWGVAGFIGAGIRALMIGRDVALPLHFVGIAAVARRTLQWGGMLAFIGMTLTTWLPGLVTSIISFFPGRPGHLRHNSAGCGGGCRSSSMAPSAAIAAVLTIGFLGTLIGPPLIGFLSETFGLRYAFLVCVALSLGVIYRAGKIPQ